MTSHIKKQIALEKVNGIRTSAGLLTGIWKMDDLTVRVGISGTDVEGAKKNLYAEAPVANFNHYVQKSFQEWETVLSKTPIVETDPNELAKYYTALYHCYTVPNTWSDVDHRYRGMDQKIHTAEGYTRYTVFSLWDTFRAYHPLMSTIEPERTRDWIHTFLEMYKERGELPVWELAANETYCMIGYHSVPVIYDAYMRGITDFDHKLALEAMVASASGPQEEKILYEKFGYVPSDQFSESVSKTLEFAYDDWCIAQFAKALGDEKVYERFIQRAQNWKNVFDPETHFMRPRRNGGFPTPFDPYQVDFNFTEANSWQYSFFVPHDIETLVAYHGGEEEFYSDVDELFNAINKTTGREQSDITGLIGQYAHGNEPSHHAALLYRFGTAPLNADKDMARVQIEKICRELYSNTPDGLCGNEDCGQMSAWFVLAKNNLYPVCPGNPTFIDFRPPADRNKQAYIGQKKVLAAEKINSKINDHLVIPQPIIQGGQQSYRDSVHLHVTCADPNSEAELIVTAIEDLAGGGTKEEIILSRKFKKSWNETIQSTGHENRFKVEATAIRGDDKSVTSTSTFIRKDNHIQIISLSPYNPQYTGGGPDALVDGIKGGSDFRTGAWQAWQGQDVEVVVDLGAARPITTIGVSCLEEIKSWIWFPSMIEILISNDGVKFSSAGYLRTSEPQNDYTPKTKEFVKNLRGHGRYVKLVIKPAFPQIPSWHLGAGEKPWIFADEIIIR
ncbi:MAG: GH92 family glycosyl hydrolase [Flavobacteriales bacterium]|nr:GH92 family glycosyl hydrolase [Flavobacteriales bacterium]